MSRTSKGRREAYDNIAVGSAVSTREKTISGALPPANTTYGNDENIQVATDYGQPNSQVAVDELSGENVAVGG